MPKPERLGDEAVTAWKRLGAIPLDIQRVERLKHERKSSVYRLVPYGPTPAAVIAKRRRRKSLLREWTIYERILSARQPPALRCYGYIDEPESPSGWLFLEEAVGEEFSPDLPEHRALAARWLGSLHVATPAPEPPLPDRGPAHFLEHLRSARADILRHLETPSLGPADTVLLKTVMSQADVLEAQWEDIEAFCADVPRTLVHGDLGVQNVRVRPSGNGMVLLVFDWEMAGRGVPAVDLAQFTARSLSPELTTYWSIVRESWPHLDLRGVRRLANVGRIFRLLAAIAWEASELGEDGADLETMRIYAAALAAALHPFGWDRRVEVRG